MKLDSLRFLLMVMVAAAMVAFLGCGGDSNNNNGLVTVTSTATVTATATATVTPGAPTLQFLTQPNNVTVGIKLNSIQVQAVDSSGAVVTSFNGPVTLTLGNNPSGATLSGTTTVNAVNGVATFSDLSINKAGTGYTLVAQSPGTTSATSNAFSVGALTGVNFDTLRASGLGVRGLVHSVEMADFNGDGKMDVAAIHGEGGKRDSVSINLGDGNGNFTNSALLFTQSSPYALTVADFNGDGKPDIATCNKNDDSISVSLNNASGTFETIQNFAVDAAVPRDIVSGDFNGDGKIDLAVTGQGTTTVLLGKGDGTFGQNVGTDAFDIATIGASDPRRVGLAAVQLNPGTDSHLDLVVGYADSVQFLLGDGSGDMTAQAPHALSGSSVSTSVGSVVAGDLLGDGNAGIVTANRDGSINVVLVSATGSIRSDTAFSTQATGLSRSLSLADVDGDGRLDIICSNISGIFDGPTQPEPAGRAGTNHSFSVFLQNTPPGGSPFIAFHTAAVANALKAQPIRLPRVLADVNGDGKPDIICGDRSDSGIVVGLNDGTGHFGGVPTPIQSGGDRPMDVVSADFDGDGQVNLAVANRDSDTVTILLNDGSGGFPSNDSIAVGSTPTGLVVGDFNEDGNDDIAVTNEGDSTVTVLLGDGNGNFPTIQGPFSVGTATDLSPRGLATGDLNGDGHLDIVTANHNSGTASVLLGNGAGAFGTATEFSVGAQTPRNVVLGDVNGDGVLDVVVAANNRAGSLIGTLTTLLGDGSGSFGSATLLSTTLVSSLSVALGDLDGDGNLDVVAGARSSMVQVFQGDGHGVFTPQAAITTGQIGSGKTYGHTIQGLDISDMNGDGLPDVVLGDTKNGYVSILLNSGGLHFDQTPLFLVGDRNTAVVATDVNGDGKPDIVVSDSGARNGLRIGTVGNIGILTQL